MNTIQSELQFAFSWRKKLGLLNQTETVRIFYGPGESSELKSIAIDLFQEHAWITQWEKINPAALESVLQFLRLLAPWGVPIQSVVLIARTSKPAAGGKDKDVEKLWGTPPDSRFSVQEFGIPYLIQLTKTKHPGLFLDHAPLRRWLMDTQEGKRVLNLFSYTGSLSLAAAKGGANFVTTLDLSKPTIEWAKENWSNASLPEAKGQFIYGDALEWLPRLEKKKDTYDTIICDPPSFSRSKKGTFSTQKDSIRLHKLIFPILNVGGTLVTSINSENYAEADFLGDVNEAAKACNAQIKVLKKIDLPESFPTSGGQIRERYLKGFIILRQR